MNAKTVSWLDSSAVPTLFLAKPRFEMGRDLLAEAAKGRGEVRIAQISLTEIAHGLGRDYDEATAREDIRLLLELALTVERPTHAQCVDAGLLRNRVKLSTADAIIAVQAMAAAAELVHKDPEFEVVANLRQRCLPYKKRAANPR
ncbi:MAG: PIN domain-containing protein [Chthoniobacterales bacterium]